MGALIGAGFGLGLVFVGWFWVEPRRPVRPRRERRAPLAGLMVRAGVDGVSPATVVAASVALGLIAAVVAAAISGVAVIGLLAGAAAASAPISFLRGRARRRLREHAESWPDAVDHLSSAVRAGLSLPEALTQLGERGPEALRESFRRFGRDYQSTGRFDDALDRLKHRLADPVGDRVVEALRLARDVGGGDLGRVLRALSGFLRDDLRTRGELESRQSWTVNGARLAVAAPWVVLLSMSLQPDVIARFGTPAGMVVLVSGAAVCLVSYRVMTWLGRLPTERRVLA